MGKTIKILLVSHSNFLGGAELCFIEMIKALKLRKNYEIHALFPLVEGELRSLCEPLCYKTYTQYLPTWIDDGTKYSLVHKWKRFINIISSIKKSIKLVRKISPDVVVTNTSVIPEFAVAKLFSKFKHGWFIHELVNEGILCDFIYGKKFSKKIISHFSDVVLVNSKFVETQFTSVVKKERLKLLYQPVEIDLTENNKTEIEYKNTLLTLLIVGKVAEFKGQKEAILACRELKDKNFNFILLIVGAKPSPYLEILKTLVEKDNLTENVEFIAFTQETDKYYRQSDVLLVCSQCEALGRVTIEAMKMGLPVVASDRGGNLELIQPHYNGLLYQLGNPKDLADKIIQLQNEKLRKQMGENGKKWANSQFNMGKFSDELDNIIKATGAVLQADTIFVKG